jgi:hypothetical protein
LEPCKRVVVCPNPSSYVRVYPIPLGNLHQGCRRPNSCRLWQIVSNTSWKLARSLSLSQPFSSMTEDFQPLSSHCKDSFGCYSRLIATTTANMKFNPSKKYMLEKLLQYCNQRFLKAFR